MAGTFFLSPAEYCSAILHIVTNVLLADLVSQVNEIVHINELQHNLLQPLQTASKHTIS